LHIETERLVLRQWRPDDVDALLQIYAHPEVARWLGPATQDDVTTSIERYEHAWDVLGFGRWAVDDRASRRLVGRVGVMRQPSWGGSAVKDEIGWVVERARWGEGLATEAARAAVADVFARVGLPAVVSFALPENVASRRVMEHCGMRERGVALWAGRDHVWYSLGVDDWRRRSEQRVD